MTNEFLNSLLISLAISLTVSVLLGMSRIMSNLRNNESRRVRIEFLSFPTFTAFLIPMTVILTMFVISQNEYWGLAQYQIWLMPIGFVSYISLIQLRRYSPEQKLVRFNPRRFIVDHYVMKYGLFVTMFFVIFLFILFESKELLTYSDETYNFLTYSMAYLIIMTISLNRCYSFASKPDSAFVLSKAYCTQFAENQVRLDKISHLNQTLKKYNQFLEQKHEFFIDNRLEIVQKYITVEDVTNLLNSDLMAQFNTDDHGRPMDYIFKHFNSKKTILKDNAITDKLKNNLPILSIIISILIALTGLLPLAEK